jgi:hypothetical protein
MTNKGHYQNLFGHWSLTRRFFFISTVAYVAYQSVAATRHHARTDESVVGTEQSLGLVWVGSNYVETSCQHRSHCSGRLSKRVANVATGSVAIASRKPFSLTNSLKPMTTCVTWDFDLSLWDSCPSSPCFIAACPSSYIPSRFVWRVIISLHFEFESNRS